MDRPVDIGVIRQQRIRFFIQGLLFVSGIVGVSVWFIGWIAPSVSRVRIQTSVVDVGRVEATVTASGTVIPAFERVITSPIASRVQHILKQPGIAVAVGDQILALDLNEVQLKLQKLDESLALTAHQETKLEIALTQTLNDLESQQQVKTLDLQYLEAEHSKVTKMCQKGLISQDELRLSRLALEKARVEHGRLARSIVHARQSMQAQLEGLVLEMEILKSQKKEVTYQLAQAEIRADRAGVLTWVVSEEGASVQIGEVVARVADLSAFHVEGKISEIHAGRLYIGLLVKVVVNEDVLMGKISRILPTLEAGIVTFLVALDKPAHDVLRSNLRVEVFPVFGAKEDVLRVVRGPFFRGGEGVHDVFVIRGDRAVKLQVGMGLLGVDFLEVVSGLQAGDEVIVSDMRDYVHMESVAVK